MFDAQKAKKNKGQGPEKGKKGKSLTALQTQIKSLQSNITDLTCKIAAITKDTPDGNDKPQDSPSNNAGDEFGGHSKKQQKSVS